MTDFHELLLRLLLLFYHRLCETMMQKLGGERYRSIVRGWSLKGYHPWRVAVVMPTRCLRRKATVARVSHMMRLQWSCCLTGCIAEVTWEVEQAQEPLEKLSLGI